LVLGRLSGASVVVSEHYTGFQRGLITGYDRFTARIAFRFADLVAAVSADLARHVQAIEPRARVRVVENVVDTDVFHPPAQPHERPPDGSVHLLTVAALTAKKGHAHLLEALAALQTERDVTLDLVGDGELRGELWDHAHRLGLGESVRFHGELLKDEVADCMRRADLFVLPSLFENLPCVLIEATASGLPSVATTVGGVADLLEGAGGVLCWPGDHRALAAAISGAVQRLPEIDPEALASAARGRFGYEAVARTWTEIYAGLRGGADPLKR
jgi:glycosyltransferase involved in cell wall biosynthesis